MWLIYCDKQDCAEVERSTIITVFPTYTSVQPFKLIKPNGWMKSQFVFSRHHIINLMLYNSPENYYMYIFIYVGASAISSCNISVLHPYFVVFLLLWFVLKSLNMTIKIARYCSSHLEHLLNNRKGLKETKTKKIFWAYFRLGLSEMIEVTQTESSFSFLRKEASKRTANKTL